jgi:ribosomal protein L40E
LSDSTSTPFRVRFTDSLGWMAAQMGVYAAMSEDEREALHEWERLNIDGHSVGTSDWPGWVKYIGEPPWYNAPAPYRKVTIGKRLRAQVFDLDGYQCRKCGATENLCADHIIPEIKGGPTKLHNLQTLCRPCNSRKGMR